VAHRQPADCREREDQGQGEPCFSPPLSFPTSLTLASLLNKKLPSQGAHWVWVQSGRADGCRITFCPDQGSAGLSNSGPRCAPSWEVPIVRAAPALIQAQAGWICLPLGSTKADAIAASHFRRPRNRIDSRRRGWVFDQGLPAPGAGGSGKRNLGTGEALHAGARSGPFRRSFAALAWCCGVALARNRSM